MPQATSHTALRGDEIPSVSRWVAGEDGPRGHWTMGRPLSVPICPMGHLDMSEWRWTPEKLGHTSPSHQLLDSLGQFLTADIKSHASQDPP